MDSAAPTSMFDRVSHDIKDAMREKNKDLLQVLRMLKSALLENKTAPNPRDESEVVVAHVKKLRGAIETYPKDSEQVKNLEREIEMLQNYLPKQLAEETVRQFIHEIVAANQAGCNLGVVMKALTPKIKGQFDSKRATDLIKEILG